MFSLPLPLLSANRRRRNTDVSQEKGVKRHTSHSKGIRQIKRKEDESLQNSALQCDPGRKGLDTEAEKFGAVGFPGACKRTLTEFRRAAKRLPAGED